jgi:hypothetical protein
VLETDPAPLQPARGFLRGISLGVNVLRAEMDKLQKTRYFNQYFNMRMLRGIHILGGICVLMLFALAAAIFAASSVQADALFPGNGAQPTTPAIYPAYNIAPSLPHLQDASEQLYVVPGRKSGSYWYRGIASWYGPDFNGRLTANGTVYDMYGMTAATTEFGHRLPLGTKVRVTDSHNGRSVVVRITDRGPLPPGRVLDLSYGAAQKLAMVDSGIAHVRVEVLRWGRNHYYHPQKG